MSGEGKYVGRIVFSPLPDGRLMQLLEPFSYIDTAGVDWPVPINAQVDGASIPQALWSVIGSPFTGLYRDASVIHDYYCDVRLRPWKTVHRVFYDAMITSGVSVSRAKLMYAAVYYAGPKWTEQASHNTQLPVPPTKDRQFSIQHSPFAKDVMTAVEVNGISVADFLNSDRSIPPSGEETRLDLKQLEQMIERYDPSPEQIAGALDTSADVMDALIPKQRTLFREAIPQSLQLPS